MLYSGGVVWKTHCDVTATCLSSIATFLLCPLTEVAWHRRAITEARSVVWRVLQPFWCRDLLKDEQTTFYLGVGTFEFPWHCLLRNFDTGRMPDSFEGHRGRVFCTSSLGSPHLSRSMGPFWFLLMRQTTVAHTHIRTEHSKTLARVSQLDTSVLIYLRGCV